MGVLQFSGGSHLILTFSLYCLVSESANQTLLFLGKLCSTVVCTAQICLAISKSFFFITIEQTDKQCHDLNEICTLLFPFLSPIK